MGPFFVWKNVRQSLWLNFLRSTGTKPLTLAPKSLWRSLSLSERVFRIRSVRSMWPVGCNRPPNGATTKIIGGGITFHLARGRLARGSITSSCLSFRFCSRALFATPHDTQSLRIRFFWWTPRHIFLPPALFSNQPMTIWLGVKLRSPPFTVRQYWASKRASATACVTLISGNNL